MQIWCQKIFLKWHTEFMVSELAFGFWWKISLTNDIGDHDALISKITFLFKVKNIVFWRR